MTPFVGVIPVKPTTPAVPDDVPLLHGVPMDVRVDDIVGTERVAGLPRVCTLCEILEGGVRDTTGFVPKARLVPGSTSSVEPKGIPVFVDDVAVAIPGMVGVLAVVPQMVGVGKSVEVELTDEALMPPPSKVEVEPVAPELDIPLGEHAVLPALVVTPTLVGPRPPGLISVAPRGIPVGPAGARGEVVNAGEVAVVL